MKKRIRLTESDLHRIVKESVNRVLNEVSFGKYNTMIDKARENARLKYQRIASGKFDTPEEQQAYVDDMMSKFEDRVKGTASLYNSYGGREKKNAPQFDFNLNDPIPNEAPYSYNYGSNIARTRNSVQKAGGVTFPEEDIRYTIGVSDTQNLPHYRTDRMDGTCEKIPERIWSWNGARSSNSNSSWNTIHNQKGRKVSTAGMNAKQIAALNALYNNNNIGLVGDAIDDSFPRKSPFK